MGSKLHELLKKAGGVVHIIIRNPFRQSLRLCHLSQGDGFSGGEKVSGSAQSRPLGEGGLTRSGKTEGVIPLYDRIMNLYKHFCKGLDSRAKTIIMVLALRNKEC